MMSELPVLLASGLAYLLLLFFIAWSAVRGIIPRAWITHPATYVLSLGVYASAWSLFGSVGLAYTHGFGYLAYYLGLCGAFVLAPVLLVPILRIARNFQLASLADLLAFRYRSHLVGTLSALVNLLSGLLLIALQVNIVVEIIHILVPDASTTWLSGGLCLFMFLFTLAFGVTRNTDLEKNEGLIAAVAFDSVFKLIAFTVIGLFSVYGIFGGFSELNAWLEQGGIRMSGFGRPLEDGPWRALLLVFFGSAVVMPHMFHMTFKENISPKSLYKASWGLPLYLFLMSLPVPLILWGALRTNVPTTPDFYTLGIALAQDQPVIMLLAYLGALSGATGLIMVTTKALAAILLNHVVLPVYPPSGKRDIYRWVSEVKGVLVLTILATALVITNQTVEKLPISVLGVMAFTAGIQLLPAVLGVIYWPLGNHKGVIGGVLVGMIIWTVTMLAPQLTDTNLIAWLGWAPEYQMTPEDWHIYTLVGLTLNTTAFVLISLFTDTPVTEQNAAQSCSVDTLSRPARRELEAASSDEFKTALSKPLGEKVAEREVARALRELGLPDVEYRPYALRRLRDQIEANLSGLLGPSVAQNIVKSHLSYKATDLPGGRDIYYVEKTLEDYQSRLTGLAAELDSLRRYHRQTLQNLPIAACSLGNDLEILMWNDAMVQLTDIEAHEIIGSRVFNLPRPWSELFYQFAVGEEMHLYKQRIDLRGKPHWLSLHKAQISGPENIEQGQVILAEDNTETQLLEDKLMHSERLASIGRLAAGVAHEIGNPVTGIACLAQNMKLETDDENLLEIAQQIIDQTKRISTIVQSLMNFSRAGNRSHTSSEDIATLSRCVDEAINLISLSEKEKQIEYINFLAPTLQVNGDEQRLVQVFVNLLGNARDASPEKSIITITGKQEGYSVIIEVTDQGSGIPPEQLDQIFEPFYTTKAPGQGTGLGLALVYSIIEEHYGNIQVFSPVNQEKGTGTRVVISLPALSADKPT